MIHSSRVFENNTSRLSQSSTSTLIGPTYRDDFIVAIVTLNQFIHSSPLVKMNKILIHTWLSSSRICISSVAVIIKVSLAWSLTNLRSVFFHVSMMRLSMLSRVASFVANALISVIFSRYWRTFSIAWIKSISKIS